MKKLILMSFLLVIAGVANARSVDRFVINDGMVNAWRNPSVSVESDGDIHVVAQGMPVANINTNTDSADDIYYFRISKGGTLRTPMLGISTAGAVHDNGRAHVLALPDGKAIVAWREHSPHVVKAAIVDPAANSGAGGISVAAVTVMDSATASAQHFDMALDGTHVHFIMNASSAVWHARLNSATLASEVAPHLVTGLTSYWQDVKVVADAAGNLHVVNRSNLNSGYPYYAMLNTAGVPQIGETILHDDGTGNAQGYPGNHLAIYRSGDNIKVLFGDKRNTLDGVCGECWEGQGGSAFLVTIDPSAHSGAVGDPGDIDELRVGNERFIGNLWYFQGFKGSDGNLHVMGGVGGKGAGDIAYYEVGGDSVSRAIIEANNNAYHYYRKYVVGAGNMIVWAESTFVPTLDGATTRLVAAKVSDFGGGGGGGGGAPAPLMLLVLGIAGLLRARLRA